MSILLLLSIGTGRATWIDSVAVIDTVSEPKPSRDGEVHGEVTEAEDSRQGWTGSTQAPNNNPNPNPNPSPNPNPIPDPDPNPNPNPNPNPSPCLALGGQYSPGMDRVEHTGG